MQRYLKKWLHWFLLLAVKNTINGLDIKATNVVVFNFDTLEILDVCENYTRADESSCDLFHQGIDARFDSLSYFDESINAQKLIGMKMNQFQHFNDNNKHPLVA